MSYVGVYNEVGLDAGYNRYGGALIGYGKCDWLNSFSYNGEADLNVMEKTNVSPIKIDHIMSNIRKQMMCKRIPFVQPKVFGR